MNNKESFLHTIFEKARSNPKIIVLPEGTDERIIHAAKMIVDKKIARIVLLGNSNEVNNLLKKHSCLSDDISIIDPTQSPQLEEYANTFFELRKHKGITESEAIEAMKKNRFFATMMLKKEVADGFVAGATHSTKDTIIPPLQIIKAKPTVSLVSSIFFMVLENKTFIFGDCAIVEFPSAEELADIAIESANTALTFGIQPKVALLSYSTKGSASSSSTKRISEATKFCRQKLEEKYGGNSPIIIDGELQADAAIVESVAALKAPDSLIKGDANVLIFPNIDSGNIAYKLTQRLAGADAYGPILQGMAKPVNDLSRGCSAPDIEGIVAITAVQAQGETQL